MEKLIAWLLVASAAATLYLSFFDPTRVFVG
jgi:hypothetical protein